MLKTKLRRHSGRIRAYHLGEGRVLKTIQAQDCIGDGAYHLGEGRVLKTVTFSTASNSGAYHLGEGRVLKTASRGR